jgi:predicted O-methyltransferase YrrM
MALYHRGPVEFEAVRDIVDGIPHMDAHYGKIVYEHVRAERPELILELGTANGVSAAYMAAALDAVGGSGRIVSIDVDRAAYTPGPKKVFADVGLEDRARFIRVPDSSYDWFLKDQVAERSDGAGNCEPLYDCIFIDGAHEFTIDGLAATLCEKLLKPGGWLLLDDLDWSYSTSPSAAPLMPVSEDEYKTPHVQAVYDLIVKQNPVFTEFRDEDGHWGWAKKAPGQPRKLTLETTERLSDVVTRKALGAIRAVRSRKR